MKKLIIGVVLLLLVLAGILQAGWLFDTGEKIGETAHKATDYVDEHNGEWKRRVGQVAHKATDYVDDHKEQWKDRISEVAHKTTDYVNEHKEEWEDQAVETGRDIKSGVDEFVDGVKSGYK